MSGGIPPRQGVQVLFTSSAVMFCPLVPTVAGINAGKTEPRSLQPSHLAGSRLLPDQLNHACQSPVPGFAEKYWSLSAFPSHSFQSGGGVFLTAMFGQIFEYSAFSNSHFSSPGSVSGLIASTGHSGSHTPQSMHSSGWITKRPFLGEALALIGRWLAQQYEVPQIVPERLASLLDELARYDGGGE